MSCYYSHDANMWNDPKIIKVRRKHGIAGYGLVNRLNELLRVEKDNRLGLDEDTLDDLVFDLHDPIVDRDMLEDIILHFKLYEREDDEDNEDNEFGYFYSKRMRRNMEKMEEIKQKRSYAGQMSGKARQVSNTSSTSVKQKGTIKVKEKKSKLKETKLNISFDDVWNLYDYKVGSKDKNKRKWESLTNIERENIMENIPLYKTSTPDKQYRKHFSTYLNNRGWEDEIAISSNGVNDFEYDGTGNFRKGYCDKCNEYASYRDEDLLGESRCCNAKILNKKKQIAVR